MALPGTILMFMAMLLAAVLVEPVATRLRLPFGAALVLVGFVGSELWVAVGGDTGLRWHDFHNLVFYVFLPVLIFESAFHLDIKLLVRNLFTVLVLAVPLMILSTLITAAVLFYGVGYPAHFPWIAALLAGALLSATDPVAVLDVFRRIGVPERLSLLVDGESLFNDATAIVLFMVFLGLALEPGEGFVLADATLDFLRTFFGGLLIGSVIGGLALVIIRAIGSQVARGVISVVCAYAGFVLAEHFHVSGVMSVLAAGLIVGWNHRRVSEGKGDVLGHLWAFNGYVANAMIFLLMGFTVHVGMFRQQWLAMLLGILAVLVARATGIFLTMPLIGLLPGVEPVSRAYQAVMFWGGLRGAVALALALSLPLELPYWYTIQSAAYGVVLFTLFIQAPTMPWLVSRLQLQGKPT